MPDDPILTEVSQVEQPAPPAPVAPVGVSREEVASAIAQALGPVTQTLQQLAANSTPKPVDQSEEDFANQFYQKPRETLRREVLEAANPIVSQVADISAEFLIDRQRDQIDAKYGPGTYQEVFAKHLDPVFEEARRSNPELLLNRKAIENAFKTVTGDNFDTLVDRAAGYKKSREEAEIKDRTNLRDQLSAEMGNLTGGFRNNNKPVLTAEHKEILADMKRATGENLDGDYLLGIRGKNTYEDWKAAQKASKGAN